MAELCTDNTLGLTDTAWTRILADYPQILDTVSSGGFYEIQAKTIKKYREPRLMTKHDTQESVPKPLKSNHLSVLPISRSAYVIGDFKLYKKFPDTSNIAPRHRRLPEFETLRVDSITSEANAINALKVSGILESFLGCDNLYETFNGRMGTKQFTFNVDRVSTNPASINVSGAQLEIDGGFECDDCVVIMEAKNVRHNDFNVRQLYYPYRLYSSFVKKPIRLVFSQYTNLTYNLYEYAFVELDNYSSLQLVKQDAYTFSDDALTVKDLLDLCVRTYIKTDDNNDTSPIPFPQADRFDRVTALMERLGSQTEIMTTDEVADFMGTTTRQAAYYPAAGEYLGLFIRERGTVRLSAVGERIINLPYRERMLAFAERMFQHRVFNEMFVLFATTGKEPRKCKVMDAMRKYNVCNTGNGDSMLIRRSSTVIAWLRWLIAATDF